MILYTEEDYEYYNNIILELGPVDFKEVYGYDPDDYDFEGDDD